MDSQEEAPAYGEISMYNTLLQKLQPCTKFTSKSQKKRKQEEYMKEKDGKGGKTKIKKSPRMLEEEQKIEEGFEHKIPESNGIESEDDSEFSHSEEDVSEVNGQSAERSGNLSSFNVHLSHILSNEEANSLKQSKWKYKWEAPAVGKSKCKWIGTGENFLVDSNANSCDSLKPKLYKHWLDINKTSGVKDMYLSQQKSFFALCSSYRDVFYCNKKPFYLKGLEDLSVMDAYLMHTLNHIFKTRDIVTENDSKVAKQGEDLNNDKINDDAIRDQGFTRPKVLILLPLASILYRLVKRLIQLTPPSHKVNVEYLDRFSDKFGSEGDEDNDEEPNKSSKPSDFEALFEGNNEDNFMVGIKFTRKSIKLFSDFYTSDAIVASPLSLINKIDEAQHNKEKDVDYLSSVEILIIDYADVIAMQNWFHVKTVFQHLNKIPSKQHGTDIMRIRPWYLDDNARFYRQTIVLGHYSNPDINALFNHDCFSYQGKVKLVCEYKGVLQEVLPQIQQIYERFHVESLVDADDARFDYFVKKVFPKIKDSDQGGIMLFISSYFEYVRIRNFLKKQDASFCLLGEYTDQSDISRARVWFFNGQRKIMLYTERSHFYHRYKIRGTHNLIIYSLPERQDFYPEIVNMLNESHDKTCTILFSRFDLYRLERIVGTAPAKRMVNSENGVFVFC